MLKNNKQYFIVFLMLISFILFIGIMKWIDYLFKHGYITSCNNKHKHKENFNNANIGAIVDKGTPETSHTVNLPLTDPIDCKNKCINARCSASGHQCLSDIDCPGCLKDYSNGPFDAKPQIKGDNDAGKLTVGTTPQYSTLTTDIGTHASIYNKDDKDNKVPAVPAANFGPSIWRYSSDYAQNLFNKRYDNVGKSEFSISNSIIPTTTGMFNTKGPLPANW